MGLYSQLNFFEAIYKVRPMNSVQCSEVFEALKGGDAGVDSHFLGKVANDSTRFGSFTKKVDLS